MRAPSHPGRGSVGFNMTPMIDVVFLLIIFFLVSSHLARQEVQMELDLPEAGTGERPAEDDTRRVIVNVLPQAEPGGQLMVGGRAMQPDELASLIAFEAEQTEGPLEVRIRTDRRAPYRLVEPIMLACADAGVWRVTFAVIEK
jgi:biopolymer transport protein ExbD